MAQAGMHGLVGIALRKLSGNQERPLLGMLLGGLIPDMDNLGVAVATLARAPTEGIHRTLTHSVFFMLALLLVFYAISRWRNDRSWANLGIGLAMGVLLHSLLDLLIWFNGVAFFWPFPIWVNLWAGTTPAAWFMKLMDPAEFLFFALYLWTLGTMARKAGTDAGFLKTLRTWVLIEAALFAAFAPLAYLMGKGYLTVFGAFYLLSSIMAFFVTIRMRATVGAAAA